MTSFLRRHRSFQCIDRSTLGQGKHRSQPGTKRKKLNTYKLLVIYKNTYIQTNNSPSFYCKIVGSPVLVQVLEWVFE